MPGWLRASLPLALVAAAGTAASAQDLGSVAQAVAAKDWVRAASRAATIDRREGGQFLVAYVATAHLVDESRCAEAAPALAALTAAQPYFAPTHELAYLCAHALGDREAAIAELNALLAILPAGPEHELVSRLRQRELAKDRPAIEVYGGLTPSTNANRATVARTLPGSDWSIVTRATPGVLASGGASATFNLFDGPGFSFAGVVGGDLGYSTATNLISPTLSTALPMTFGSLGGRQVTVAPFAAGGLNGLAFGSSHVGARAALVQPLTAAVTLGLDGAASYAHYTDGSGYDGIETEAHLSGSWQLDPSMQLSGQLSASYDYTFEVTWRTLDLSLLARVDRLLSNGFIVGLQGSVGTRLHASPPPAQPAGEPDQIDLYAGARLDLANRNIVIGPFMPVIYYGYRVQASNNVFYAYDAHDIGVALRARF